MRRKLDSYGNVRLLTDADVRDLIKTEITRHGSGHKLARKWGVSPPFLSMVLTGRRAPGPRVLQALGLEQRVVYIALSSRPYFSR